MAAIDEDTNDDNDLEDMPEELASPAQRQRNSRSFLFFLGSVLAILLLGVLLNLQVDTATRIFLFLGLAALLMVGFILLDKNASDAATVIPAPQPFKDISEENNQESEENATELEQSGPETDTNQQDLTPFELLVREALDSIPEEFHEQMDNLVVMVEDEPDEKTLAQVGVAHGQTLLGLYHGIPLTHIGHQHALIPERITIYQQTIERYCGHDPERIRQQVRATVLHEIAHHFGMDHDEMPIWVK